MSSTLALSSAVNRPIATAATCVESNALSSCCYYNYIPVATHRLSLDINSNTNSLCRVRPRNNTCYASYAYSFYSAAAAAANLTYTIANTRTTRRRMVACEVALRSNNSATIITEGEEQKEKEEEEEEEALKKIGARVRVKVPLKVYHVPRLPEVDLTGMEGFLKQYVAIWKGKRISANLPFKVEFVIDVPDRGPVKFFAHLKEDEFEYLDS